MSASSSEVRLDLRVQPKASRNQLRVGSDGRLKASVTATPTGGEANAAVCALLAREFGVPKSAVRILRGESSREKTVGLAGTTPEAVRIKIAEITNV